MSGISAPLVFLRHGQTKWNQQGLYQGSKDTKLSPQGAIQATENARLIEKLATGNSLDPTQLQIVSSPLQRAKQTAEIIADTIGHQPPVGITPAFRELSMGRWEGLTTHQVKDRFHHERKSRKTDRWNFKPQGGESLALREAEVRTALAALGANTIIVTHSGILRVLLHILGGDTVENAASGEFPHVGLLVWDGAILHRQM